MNCVDCGDPTEPGRLLCRPCDNEMEREQERLDAAAAAREQDDEDDREWEESND